MKTPDKIFLEKDKETYKIHHLWVGERLSYSGYEHIEYIRKDALLAFLNERRKGLTSGDSFVAGERKMLKEIIEKIESL